MFIRPPRATILASGVLIVALSLLWGGRSTAPAAAKDSPKGATASKEDKTGWKKLFDGKTLTGWKSFNDEDADGKVSVKDGAIVIDKGKLMAGIVYTRSDFPKVDYEVTLEGKRLAGGDFFCTTTFPVGEAYCSFVVGGWHGTVVGLSNINGANASENETTRTIKFENDRWYAVRIRVTKQRIEAWIDKEQMVDQDTTDRKIDIHLACRKCRPFGIATWDSVGAIRNIQVRALSEKEKKQASEKKRD